ncbi:uncharacterized protein TM35_000132360 [Trypanosoma theileri]|uniref:Uncharacterized protein n=1 Tax=Trypanosoma theileri TaxID=67003 RepID=A0A1X0NX26_9TRYP|nr:uncharacterized protein TM35_000132360 [Trypanosoma theileri]ORC89232.1 hypothetical protein TM35_000132360 [Trypanosoma theileri]
MSSPVIIGCCASFTLTAGVVLLIFAALMFHNSWTFEVIAAKQEWDLVEKAACCRNAGLFYMILSLLLWLWIVLGTILGKKNSSRCRFWPFSHSPNLTVLDMGGDEWSSRSNSESHPFPREVAPLLTKSPPSSLPFHTSSYQSKQTQPREGLW